MPRWICPECGKGKNGPQRPRMDNVVRYCLACSEKSGVLVRRSAPALEKKRAAAYTRSQEKAAAKRERQRDTETRAGIHIPSEARRIWRLMKPYHRGRAMPEIVIRNKSWGSSGHCKIGQGEIIISISADVGPATVWQLLAHELCHEARRYSLKGGRAAMHDERFYTILTEVTRKRFGVSTPLYEHAGRWGYAVDHLIEVALHRAGLTSKDGVPFIDKAVAAERAETDAAREAEA